MFKTDPQMCFMSFMRGPISAFAHLPVDKRLEYFAVKAKDYRKVISYRSGSHVTSLASRSVTDDLSVQFGVYS